MKRIERQARAAVTDGQWFVGEGESRGRWWRFFVVVLAALLAAPLLIAKATGPRGSTQPKSAIGWLRRAADFTDIRFPGSKPFHLVATFHGYRGLDFAPKGKSPIMTGSGTYEETWLSPHEWRREITYGSYHAVEVEADGVRKFEANSDYEPSRVLMFIQALLYPIRRYDLEPELQLERPHWKLKRLTAGGLPYVQIGDSVTTSPSTSNRTFFDFLPDGVLFRSLFYGILTGWQDPVRFGGRLAPTRITVQGLGLGRNLVTAAVRVEPLVKSTEKIVQISGSPAQPGSTLRPFSWHDIRTRQKHLQMPAPPVDNTRYPEGIAVYTSAVVDRQGTMREPEVVGIDIQGQRPSDAQFDLVIRSARSIIGADRRTRFAPPTVDDAPCEFVIIVVLVGPAMG